MNKKQIITLLAEVLFAALVFGGFQWAFDVMDGRQEAAAGHAIVEGLVFGVIYVPISLWLRKKDREIEK